MAYIDSYMPVKAEASDGVGGAAWVYFNTKNILFRRLSLIWYTILYSNFKNKRPKIRFKKGQNLIFSLVDCLWVFKKLAPFIYKGGSPYNELSEIHG